MYACMEGVINEVTRGLAVRGAQILLNSLNSFATDEASLHVPVRAAENKVWVVAANKVGPLIPADRLAQVGAGLGVPVGWLHGAGESQIVAPDGTVVARAPRTGEAVVVADIDPAAADAGRARLLATRRPARYAAITRPPARPHRPAGRGRPPGRGGPRRRPRRPPGRPRRRPPHRPAGRLPAVGCGGLGSGTGHAGPRGDRHRRPGERHRRGACGRG
ncbi:nitrilase-related carbon-nitrogen hydrolase [Nonomuraea ferruginea]